MGELLFPQSSRVVCQIPNPCPSDPQGFGVVGKAGTQGLAESESAVEKVDVKDEEDSEQENVQAEKCSGEQEARSAEVGTCSNLEETA